MSIARDPECRATPLPPKLLDRRVIGGYAAVFDTPSRDLGEFVEIVTRSAFNKSRSDNWLTWCAKPTIVT
jgi:hypothetical protein